MDGRGRWPGREKYLMHPGNGSVLSEEEWLHGFERCEPSEWFGVSESEITREMINNPLRGYIEVFRAETGEWIQL